MPAATRRSKSEAYEQGIREGMAMSRRARVMKPSEEEEMEMDMGMDPNHSRKRSAKGAKRTKPATDGMGKKKPMDGGMGMKKEMDGGMKKSMDMCGGMKKPMDGGMYGKKPMDGECDCRGKKGCKCDGNCGSMRKRSDSLTPQEYLAACDMGIQDHSNAYIRARLDTAAAFRETRFSMDTAPVASRTARVTSLPTLSTSLASKSDEHKASASNIGSMFAEGFTPGDFDI